MKYLIIKSHPNANSFNSAITNTIIEVLKENSADFYIRDLYGINFSPALSLEDLTAMYDGVCAEDVRFEREYVRSADVLIFVFPVIFNSIPAMLKGYLDRVFSLGFGWSLENDRPVQLLSGKKTILFCTAYSSDELSRELGLISNVNNAIIHTLHRFCGIEPIEQKYFTSMTTASADDRMKMLEETREIIKTNLLQNNIS